ncbi:unnamed protein product [Haemonchus placei]|uniref:Sod_Fe_C domain-containing protein n=1 Tax=Haemonchus placei TaxID=6290 RepID=A0A0N4VV87_HAEPC|nr:unnamed protein product [Haemonchus placei]
MISHWSLLVHKIEWNGNAGGTAEGQFLGWNHSMFKFLGAVAADLTRLGAPSVKPHQEHGTALKSLETTMFSERRPNKAAFTKQTCRTKQDGT